MEYRADKFAAQMMGSAEPVISGLNKIEDALTTLFNATFKDSAPFIQNVINLTRQITHPSTEKRNTRLSGMSF